MSNKGTSVYWFALPMLLLAVGCGKSGPGPNEPVALFRDITSDSGIDFTFRGGVEAGQLSILEVVGGGVALLDYDGDGLLDVFLTGGGYFAGPDKKEIRGHPCRLYKNLGGWRFRDVTAEVGLGAPLMYSHGCAVADYDRDGWPDLLVTGWGRLALYHNEPDGKGGRRFVEVTAGAGLTDSLWSTSAAWGDLDGDGFPDLYVCHYVNWSFNNNPPCEGKWRLEVAERMGLKGKVDNGIVTVRDVCPPQKFKPLRHTLYRNNRDGTFTDVSKAAGLYQKRVPQSSKGLGVLMADLNDDGRPDIFVANDGEERFLYLNRDTWLLEEVGLSAGVARDELGRTNQSMGVDCADYDGSGRAALWVTNFQHETHGLYRNDGAESFRNQTQWCGIAEIGRNYVGFGTAFLDVENRGWEDLVIANGHVMYYPWQVQFRQYPVLLRNIEYGTFAPEMEQGGSYFTAEHVGRGLAVGDLNNTGRPDVIVSHLEEPVAVLRNQAPDAKWLGLDLVGADHRDVVGAIVKLEVAGRTLTRFAKGGGSYLSSSDRRLLFGLGPAGRPGRLKVRWPFGGEQQFDGLAAGHYYRIVQGRQQPEIIRGHEGQP